jgi:hypothetical protein
MELQSKEWFPAFKAAGGMLDQIVQDSEESSWGMEVPAPPDSALPLANQTQDLACIRARWSAVQHDIRFATVLLQLLAEGFVVNTSAPEFLSDTLSPFSESSAAFTDQQNDTNRVVWNAVMLTRQSVYWSSAFGAPARQSFPEVR